MNPQRIQKLLEDIDQIAKEESDKPVMLENQGIQRAINLGKLAAIEDILRQILKDSVTF